MPKPRSPPPPPTTIDYRGKAKRAQDHPFDTMHAPRSHGRSARRLHPARVSLTNSLTRHTLSPVSLSLCLSFTYSLSILLLEQNLSRQLTLNGCLHRWQRRRRLRWRRSRSCCDSTIIYIIIIIFIFFLINAPYCIFKCIHARTRRAGILCDFFFSGPMTVYLYAYNVYNIYVYCVNICIIIMLYIIYYIGQKWEIKNIKRKQTPLRNSLQV